MSANPKAYLVGGGIGSLAAAFMIRDGKLRGGNISILEAAPVLGGSLDGSGDPVGGYSMRGGCMVTTDNYECTWDLYKSIPSLNHEGRTVFDETVEFNEKHKANSMARLVDRRRAKVPVASMGFSIEDRIELLKLSRAGEDALAASRITDWLSPAFFETEFWYMWSTTFAFQPWHSAVEFKRYLHGFLLEFSRIETLAGVKRTVYNQYDSLASSLGSMTSPPGKLTKTDSGGWTLWEKLAKGRPEFGNPAAFNSCIAQSCWESFTVTLQNPTFFDQMIQFTGNQPGTGGLVTFKDSNWPMSIVLACQPHFPNQAAGVQVFWEYSLFPDRVGNFVPKPMAECHGAEILRELCGHLRFDPETVESANCIPCRMPYITSMFMPRVRSDRPLPVPRGSKNFAFISQFVEIADDVVFTVEYSVRAAQMAVYELLGIDRKIPPVTPHAESVHAQFEALLKAFK
jgi:myosin-crossreactive antigen